MEGVVKALKMEGWKDDKWLVIRRLHFDSDGSMWWSPNTNANPIYNQSSYPVKITVTLDT